MNTLCRTDVLRLLRPGDSPGDTGDVVVASPRRSKSLSHCTMPFCIGRCPAACCSGKSQAPAAAEEEGSRNGNAALLAAFCAQPDDVVVATPPKSGSTILLEICHLVRTQGTRVAGRSQITDMPWIDLPVRLYREHCPPWRAPHDAEPRVFKTHGGWGKVRRCGPCRKITCWRDPVDVMLSSFHFMLPLSGLTPGDDVSLSTFCRVFIHGHGRYLRSYCADLIEWWEHRHDPDVLFLLFDEVVQHKPAAIQRVAAFMGCEADVALVALVAKMTSHAAMRADRGRFNDDALLAPSLWRRRGDVPVPLAGKVRADGGISGQGAEQVPAWAVKEVQRVWTATVAKATGLTTFAALSELRSAELRRARSRSAERPPRGV